MILAFSTIAILLFLDIAMLPSMFNSVFLFSTFMHLCWFRCRGMHDSSGCSVRRFRRFVIVIFIGAVLPDDFLFQSKTVGISYCVTCTEEKRCPLHHAWPHICLKSQKTISYSSKLAGLEEFFHLPQAHYSNTIR